MNEKSIINNEYDYSNILPTVEFIDYLVRYCDNTYKQLVNLVEQDEEKNKQFKQEYREYRYAKSYGAKFEVCIRKKTFDNIICNDYNMFVTAVNNGNLKKVSALDIKMILNFKRGNGNNLEEYNNSFTIAFRPYDITFERKSDHIESNMNEVEEQINNILKNFPVANSIFCTK